MKQFLLKIKRAETPYYAALKRTIKGALRLNIPTIRIIHLPLYYFHYMTMSIGNELVHKLWSIPVFTARCASVGKGLQLPNGIPFVIGNNLKFVLGDNVTIYRSTIGASSVLDEALLRVGNRSTIGYGSVVSVAKRVEIGDDCMIAQNCIIMDNDDHPLKPQDRLAKRMVKPEDIKPVRIGNNVWIGAYSAVLKGITIGDNSVIATHSVVTKDVLPNCLYAGFPARPTMRNIEKL